MYFQTIILKLVLEKTNLQSVAKQQNKKHYFCLKTSTLTSTQIHKLQSRGTESVQIKL